MIEDKIKKSLISICYPFEKYNNKVIEKLKEYCLFVRITKLWKYFSLSERYQIPTIPIFSTTWIKCLKI